MNNVLGRKVLYPVCYQEWVNVFSPVAIEHFWLNLWPLWLGLIFTGVLFFKFHTFPQILLPLLILISVFIVGFSGDVRGFYRLQYAKYKIGNDISFFFNRRLEKNSINYLGSINGFGVIAFKFLTEHDCRSSFLVKADERAMKYEFQSPDELAIQRIRLAFINGSALKNEEKIQENLFNNMVSMKSTVLSERNLPSFKFSWCRKLSRGYYFCEADGTQVDLASGIQF